MHTYLSVDPLRALVGVLDAPVEVDGDGVLRASLLPRVPEAQPVVRLLHLVAEMCNFTGYLPTIGT